MSEADPAGRPGAASDPALSREVLDLFDGYVHGEISRRTFLDRCALYVGSAAAASATLALLSPDFAGAEVIKPGDRRIRISTIDIPSADGSGSIQAYVAAPAGASAKSRRPVVLVVHENRGLNPHIKDIARRLAVDGFIAVAPDALTKLGGYPGDEDQARALFGKLDQTKISADFIAAAGYARTLPNGTDKLGAVGFCYGGGVVNMLAARVPALRAAVPFYGAPAPLAEVPSIKAELLLHFAGNDTRIDAMWPAYEAELKKAGKRYQAFIYPNVEHGFNNDTTPRFNPAAAALAWQRTMALFRRNLA
jgi:carboxymethylenebutenolidase